jgi:hypothetical protein
VAGESFDSSHFLEVEVEADFEESVERSALAEAAGDVAEYFGRVADGDVEAFIGECRAGTAPIASREISSLLGGDSDEGCNRSREGFHGNGFVHGVCFLRQMPNL